MRTYPLVLPLLVACTVQVNVVGKRCDAQGECPGELVCDDQVQVCVPRRACEQPSDCSDGLECIDNNCVEVQFAGDWTSSMAAVWTFDGDALGQDATSGGRDLQLVGAPQQRSSEAPQGAAYVHLDGPAGDLLSIVDTTFASSTDRSITVGGWFRVEDSSPPNVANLIDRKEGDDGYALQWVMAEDRGVCVAGANGGHGANDGLVPSGTWFHMVCRLFAQLERITRVLDGVGPDDDIGTTFDFNVGNAGANAALTISSPDRGFVGDADEVFFVNRVLTTPSIRRIFACGVDGRGCRCDPLEPTRYVSCAPVAVCETDLPPCDQPAPEYKDVAP